MGTTSSFTSCCSSSWTYHPQQIIPSTPPPPHHRRRVVGHPHPHPLSEMCSRTKASCVDQEGGNFSGFVKRRQALVSGFSLVSSAVFGFPGEGSAVVKQGLLAGRIPGLSEPDEQGWRTYRRPDEKSGGHGVGWSPIIPYVFSVPQDWQEVPVSIADLGGTEIDLRFASSKEGRLFVIVAPILRFADDFRASSAHGNCFVLEVDARSNASTEGGGVICLKDTTLNVGPDCNYCSIWVTMPPLKELELLTK